MTALVRKKITYRYLLNLLLYSAGLFASIYLMQLTSDSDGSFCKLFDSNCSEIISSSYGSFYGFPVSSFACFYFSFQIAYLLLTRVYGAATGKNVIGLPLFINAIAFLVSIYFLFVLTYKVDGYCVFCLVVHIINALTLLVNFAIIRSQKSKHFYTTSHAVNINKLAIFLIPLLLSTSFFFSTNYIRVYEKLKIEQQKISENLQYYLFKYQQAQKHTFEKEPNDTVIGEPAIAVHEIVLIYKDGCKHCKVAQDSLTEIVNSYDTAVYLLLKNFKDYTKDRLNELSVEHAPVVFINGKRADGWEIPGFMDFFTEDCGC